MTVISNPSHAMFFNGISDAVIIPNTAYSASGANLPTGEKSFGNIHMTGIREGKSVPLLPLDAFTLEAWVIPDQGGTILEYENLFRLSLGSVSSAAPARFSVRLTNDIAGGSEDVVLSSAESVVGEDGLVSYFDGAVYPRTAVDAHESYSPFIASKDDVTGLNLGHRELLQVTVVFDGMRLALKINGDMVASRTFTERRSLQVNDGRIFLGGRGGEFRGVIETIHWSRGAAQTGSAPYAPVKSDATIGLWRFEEPVSPVSTTVALPTVSASTSASSINVGATAAQTLVDLITGQSGLTSVDLTASPYSNGNYKTARYHAGVNQVVNIPHVPYNLLINPLGYSTTTGKVSTDPPERVRLTAVNVSAGTITVESVHLDYVNQPADGRRGLLHTRSVTSVAVLVSGDCLIDGGTGEPYQPEGTSTQFSHRSGQVIIDESDNENHGIVFSLDMATDQTDPFNKFAANFGAVDTRFKMGHTARHTLNHVDGHPFMGVLPNPTSEVLTQKTDGISDSFTVTFPDQYSDVRNQVAINSQVSLYDEQRPQSVRSVTSSGVAFTAVENGMAGIDDTKRALIAIGGAGTKTLSSATTFDPLPFILKSTNGETPEDDTDQYKRHLAPSSTSRMAILEVPSLAGEGYAPFVQVYYNAIDFTGNTVKYAASARLTAGIGSGGTVLTCQSVEAFGKNSQVLKAKDISIGGTAAVAADSTITATLNHSARTITFSSAATSGFQTAAASGAVVHHKMTGAVLLVEKTVPDVATTLPSGSQVIDLIHTDLNTAATETPIHAPGGVIVIDPDSSFDMESSGLQGDDTEGTDYEYDLDLSLTPDNHMPYVAADDAQGNPVGVTSANVNDATHASAFHKLVISPSGKKASNSRVDSSGVYVEKGALGVPISTGVYSHYSHAATATVVDVKGASAATEFNVGMKVYLTDGTLIGTLTGLSGKTMTFSAGISAAIPAGAELLPRGIHQARLSTNQNTALHEVFDVIDNIHSDGLVYLYVQPTDRRRHSQLSRLFTESDGPNPSNVSVAYLMSRGRVLSFGDDAKQGLQMLCHGLTSDIAGSLVDLQGAGSPDSHLVKEIMPGAPVVTVTLGGPGQGAVNTKATWDPSPLARPGWNTRRNGATRITSNSSTTIVVAPLNNESTALASWGTYGFPKTGRVYFEMPKDNSTDKPRFASAEYTSKSGTTFTFASGTGHTGTGAFMLANGQEADSLAAWFSAAGVTFGDILHVDDKFSTETICNDGTTVNDRLFQTLDSVQHDYQLGTQYASTRAMVEIPLFEEFFFDDPERGIFPGPDNSMKVHVDCTHTAHTWAPNPVGRRVDDVNPEDPEVHSAYSYDIVSDQHRRGTIVTRPYDKSNRRVYVQEADIFPIPTVAATTVGGIDNCMRPRRAYLPSGEWVVYSARDTSNDYLTVAGSATDGDEWAFSTNFLQELKVGASLTPAPGFQDNNLEAIADNPLLASAGFEGRRPFYYDRANTMTQGGNVDYGLKQYVSAVEFRAGPKANPHLERIQSGRARAKVVTWDSVSNNLVLDDASLFPTEAPESPWETRIAYLDGTNWRYAHYDVMDDKHKTVVTPGTSWNPSVGTEIIVWDVHDRTGAKYPTIYPESQSLLNRSWYYPYAPGGLRDGDTVWMNMHYTNPHAIEGMFCKSRGTLNEAQVWSGFNGGEGAFDGSPRDSIPMENFLIGNNCVETAKNFVQHVNKTIQLNYEVLGLSAAASVVAYLDPYQSTEEFARVLLYDVAHDREFIAFQDLWMQVQSSPATTAIGNENTNTTGVLDNTATYSGERLDVAAGFPSQNRSFATSTKSDFMESTYSHYSTHNVGLGLSGTLHSHSPVTAGCLGDGALPRTNEAVACIASANVKHLRIDDGATRAQSTFFDTPDGTRCIPAFLALKGIRNTALDLASHAEARLQQLKHWSEMDFTRRLSVDFGEVGVKEGVTDIEAAAREVVRLINQAGAKNGRTHSRRPADQYLGESERLDLTSVGVKADSTNRNKDPTAPHQHADFAATGSTHDPASFWDAQTAFASHDRGTHMGYVRAHLGRVVLDSSGNKGYSIVIHSTIPGASGRNFCAWLDNSRGQVPYQPQFLIGHGGRFRNYWCQPDEVTGENMHPAPMPINRHGRPFAPITTLKEMIPVEEISEPFLNNLNVGPDFYGTDTTAETTNTNLPSGRHANTVHNESFESKGPASVMVDGLRIGTQAKARINFGGFTQAGYPGWAPDAKKWGYCRDGQGPRFDHIYGKNTQSATTLLATSDVTTAYGYIPSEDIRPDSIGDGQVYGIRFVDHRGKTHTVRTLYREYGQPFANDKTTLPPTLDDEIIIHFDDRDVGQGGFTIGRHMVGAGDVCGEFTGGTVRGFKGNLWQTYPSPAVGIDANLRITGSAGAYKLEVILADPYHNAGSFSHSDVLGYLGFPDEGLIQFNDVAGSGNNGITMYYTSRSHYGKSGDSSNKHYFYGLNAGSSVITLLGPTGSALDRFISPRINWTSLLTDEVIAAAVEYAITMDDPNSESIEATSFDCTGMLAADGKTLGEWGVSPTAIRVKAHSKKHKVLPLRHLFDVTRTPDWGLQAGAAEDTVISTKHTGGLSSAERTLGTRLDVGYIPRTILNISTKYRGSNANTATPILVDSNNNVVGTTEWQQHLRGDKYRRLPGDHIIPAVMNPMVEIDGNVGTASTTRTVTLNAGQLWLFCTPASNDSNSWGEKVTAWVDDLDWALVRSEAGANTKTELTWDTAEESGDFNAKADPGANNVKILSRYAKVDSAFQVDGIRRAGSKRSSPFLYFRGGQDSPDHWVPLYFGGGFSGVVMDINDGTQNDYSEFYKHPYSGGPTGSAGLQNIGEVASSYALLDTNAMMAMFPGTPYLTQHRGMNNPPFFNQNGLLAFDIDVGQNNSASRTGVTYTGGGLTVNCTRPIPIVLRFSHPHARYSATGSASDHTTYIVFGPGQSIPHNFTSFEPQGSNIVTTGNGYSAVPIVRADGGESYLPNSLPHGGANKGGFMAYLPPSASFQRGNAEGYNFQMNWEPAYGFPNSLINATYGYNHTAGESMYATGPDFTGSKTVPQYGQLMNIAVSNFAGQTIGSSALGTTRATSVQWHMEGGHHPGGHFLDNHVSKNPKHPVDAGRLNTGSAAAHNTSSFRVAAQLATAYLGTFDSAADMTTSADFVVVDATRCENAEELGAVLSAAINTFPGSDPLKAIGGTFLPSFQTGTNQDRYGWVEYTLDHSGTGYTAATGAAAATVKVTATIASTIPDYGWLRMSSGTKSAMAPYVSFSGTTFTLGTNTLTSNTNAADPVTEAAINKADFNDADVRVYVWSKAGTHRHNNTSNSARDHMCQVHFNGLVDAVDRTKPIGAVGWHGEAYSYLNSYTANTSFGTNKHPAGLGAWHPFLGFSPYGSADTCLAQSAPVGPSDSGSAVMKSFYCNTGLSTRHLVAVSYESELPLIAKTDRDGIVCMGDWLYAKQGSTLAEAGTTQWDTAKTSNKSRYVGPATGGPNVEALFVYPQVLPVAAANYPDSGMAAGESVNWWHTTDTPTNLLQNMTPCNLPTGDLFWDASVVPASRFHESFSTYGVTCAGITSRTALNAAAAGGLYDFYGSTSAARNFTVENVVWKRMDGGNLTMPATNARGLGMVPWTVQKSGGSYYTVGEKVLGNCRFSFESTNSAMFPIIQAQELAHPQIAEQHPFEVRNALAIPNEEVQFDDLPVTDDTGQTHTLVGGSPFGTIIYDFRHVSDREVEGLAPSIAGSGISPNMKIRLPNPDEIPGNIIVRPGFDRIQAYQNETMGSGGLQHPSQSMQGLQDAFTDSKPGPRLWPFWENNGWEHISQDGTDLSTTKSTSRLAFPDSTNQGWADHTGNAPLQTAYEPHDRTLYFHVTRMGHSMTHRYDVNELTYSSHEGTVITATTAPSDAVWKDTTELSGGRYFLRIYDPTTNQGAIASYTNTSGSTFTGVVYGPDFETFVAGKTGLKIVPSYYVPGGSNRFFAARRLRDHSEYSGNSPDMPDIDWANVGATPYTQLTAPRMTPMPIPRMGHHYITPTMAMLPGHYAHPLYQRLYDFHHACRSAQHGTLEADNKASSDIDDFVPGRDPLIWFSGPTAAYGPSDIHGGAFTLLTETKIRYEGYGIAASEGAAGVLNSQGGHAIVLEATGAYTLKSHFPDPMEVGAYQIVIQPNLFKQQLSGFHRNHSDATKGPAESGSLVTELTGQQVNTVIGIEHDSSNTYGAYSLVLAEATMADVRGCEIVINEMMLDMDPDAGSQFTNIPTLGLYNPLGTNETASTALSRRSLPYQPNAFVTATPGYTMTIPWWSHLHKDGATSALATAFLQLEWFKPDNYYELSRTTYGAIGGQITMGGYPSSFLDIYETHKRIRSLNPGCVVISSSSGSGTITVDNNDLFPVVPYYGQLLEYVDANGIRRTASYANRQGTLAYATLGESDIFDSVTGNAQFWSNLAVGTILRLTGPYDTWASGKVLTDSKRSMTPRILPQTLSGTRDTNSLHSPDGYLCLWHPNLGRPFTWYSDDSSRAFYTKAGTTDTPVLKTALNVLPEHFETIHYHDFFYAASKGPFGLGMKALSPPVGAATSDGDGVVYTAANLTLGTATLTCTDGDAAHGLTAGQKIHIISTDATQKDYFVSDTSDGGVAHLSAVTAGATLKSTGSITASLTSGATGIAVGFNLSSGTQNAFLVLLKAAIEHANGHNGKITVSAVPTEANGNQAITLTQALAGTAGNTTITENLATVAKTDFASGTTHGHQGGTTTAGAKYNFGGFWPGGSRGGGGVSRLDGFGDALIGWGNQTFGIDCVGFRDNSGVEQRTYAQMTSDSEFARQHCFGYRFGLRQPYNRPRWGPAVRGYLELANANALLGYYHGPFVQQDNKTNGWDYVGSDSAQSDATFPATYVGILERLTQITSLLNEDQLGRQVRYSDGRRITRPFGCPVRSMVNVATTRRLFPDESTLNVGKYELADAHRYYMVDWWGNTRGEDVRRFPARGFGIRPAWDPEDAYTDGGVGNAPGATLFTGSLNDMQSGNTNTANNDTAAMARVDWFNPSNAMRVGDRGDGRGVRWPTLFNESLLHDISTPVAATGMLMSYNTAEPNFGQGYLRPRNDDLQNTEVKRGISARLGVSSDDGLLKPEANVGEGVESMVGSFSTGLENLADPVARTGPRIGLDADTIGELTSGVQRDYVGISTQAYSLHTDREVGQRASLRGAMQGGNRTVGDFDLTDLNWSAQPKAAVVRMSNAHAMWPLGGTYILEARNYAEAFDDTGWGNTSATNTSNPYQSSSSYKPKVGKTNTKDKVVRFLMRPSRVLDSRHISLFRHTPAVKAAAPQRASSTNYLNNFYRATSGGKYGLFTYDVPNARTGTVGPTNAPYSPVYYLDPTASIITPSSDGPKIPGADATGFDNTSIRQTVGRMVMSENTLEHFRSDAPRRRVESDDDKESRPDYTVEPRYSQSLHPKGEDATTSFNTGDHSED